MGIEKPVNKNLLKNGLVHTKFDPNHVFINVNKLNPYQFLDDKTQATYCLDAIYWEGSKNADVDNKEKDNNEKPIYMV